MNKILVVGLMMLAANAFAKDGHKSCGCSSGGSYHAPRPSPAPQPSPPPNPAPAPAPAPAPVPSVSTPSTGTSGSITNHRSYGPTTGHPLTWNLEPEKDTLAEAPQIVYVPVEVVKEVEVPGPVRIVEVPGPERIVEVPVIVERTVNVCPAEEKKPAVPIYKRVKKECK